MSRLRIIRDGTYTWLDEGPGNGANGPARVSGALLVSLAPGPNDSDRMRRWQRESKRLLRAQQEQAA